MVVRRIKNDELMHHGIKGQRWGVRRYQNKDGTLTDEGRKKYGQKRSDAQTTSKVAGGAKSVIRTVAKPLSVISNVAGGVYGGAYGGAVGSILGLGAVKTGAAVVGGVLGGALGSAAAMAAGTGLYYGAAHLVQKYADHKVETYNKKLS